ncbi:PaaX family transcriptional regulator C-terminal domain-containing protein [Citricoccus nitrophenolicus]
MPAWGEAGIRAGGPPNLMMTLLGDYWLGRAELIPSAALVDLLAVFGVASASARAALSRMVKRDLLYSEKSGRNTFYRLTDRSRAVLEEGGTKLFDFGTDRQDWDGLWSMVAFSVPEAKRSQRGSIRTKLRWQGFAPLYDGLWISPHDSVAQALAACDALGIEVATGIRGQIVANGNPAGSALRAWDLDSVASDYRAFANDACQLSEQAKAGALDDAEALVKRTNLMGEWRIFLTRDPLLPTQLLPHDWPMHDARQAFLAAYDILKPAACRCVRDIIATHAPETARTVFGTDE